MNTTALVALIALAVIVVAGISTFLFLRKRRTAGLRDRFGGAEYERAMELGGSRRHGEAGLQERAARVESFHLQPLRPVDRTRFEESWRRIQSRFVDGPAGAVAEADQLVRDVMATCGYPVAEFEQRAADISVDHPLVLKNYRTAHEIALRQTKGQASTEDLRQAMIHYRSLFDELISEPNRPPLKVAS
jgi:hypothetical protein